MSASIIVLTDFSLAAERARAYAAGLARALHAELHLVHIYLPPATTFSISLALQETNARYVREMRRALDELAADLPVPATAELIETDWDEAVQQTLNKYRPLLLVAGLTTTDGQLDDWFSNRTLPLVRQTGYPLLLIPADLPDSAIHPPRRVALAVEDRAFRLAPNATVVAPLFDSLGTEVVTVVVLTSDDWSGGHTGLSAARACGLAAGMPHSVLHKVGGEQPAAGIQHAVATLAADVLALLDRGHDWVDKLFIDSVTDQVLRQTQTPLLLLAANDALPED